MFKKILIVSFVLFNLVSCGNEVKIDKEENKAENIELTKDEEKIINEILEL